jgi:hypothetical protein
MTVDSLSLIDPEALSAFPKPLTPNSLHCRGANTKAPRASCAPAGDDILYSKGQ